MSLRFTVLFGGRVQGVGFRYTACRIARQYKVSGFVKNLSDGRVELVAEGREDHVESFVQAVRDEMAPYISGADVKSSEATNEFSQFGVAYA